MTNDVKYSYTEGPHISYYPEDIMFGFAEWAAKDLGVWVYRDDLGKWQSSDNIEDLKSTGELFQIYCHEGPNT